MHELPRKGLSVKVEQKQCAFSFCYFFGDSLSLMAENFLPIFQFYKFQGLTGANFNANRVLHVGASVTLESDFSLRPGIDDPIWAEHSSGPAGDATILLNNHEVGFRIPGQGSGKASVQARSLQTMTAL